MSLSFRKWREMALTDYPVVSDKYYKKVYENIATDPQTGESILVQLTLQGVLAVSYTHLTLPTNREV